MNQEPTQSRTHHLLPRFALGRLVATPGAMEVLREHPSLTHSMLTRHAYGDWGELCDEDKEVNEQAVQQGARLLSMYTELETKFYVITSADRTETCIMLPSEY